MLVVRVEIWPGGDPEQARVLEQIAIANDGTGDRTKANYDCVRSSESGLTAQARVTGWQRSRGAFGLVKAALSRLTTHKRRPDERGEAMLRILR